MKPMAAALAAIASAPLVLAGMAVMGSIAVLQELVAQERPLARLAYLVERKGYKDVQNARSFCEMLGVLRVNPDCLWYQYPEKEGDRIFSVNVFRDDKTGTLHVILYSHNNRDGHWYLTDLDGRLTVAFSGKKRGIWEMTRLSIKDARVRQGFSKELAYWRGKLKEMEKESDRKLVEDSTCPKGQLMQIFDDRKAGCVRP
jgi:hypothetical protein